MRALLEHCHTMILSKVDQRLSVPALHYTDVVGKAETKIIIKIFLYNFQNILPSLDPLVKAGDEVQGWADLHQAVVAQQVSLGLAGGSLEDHQVVFVVDDPEAEDGDLHTNLDGGVQTAGLLVVEVPGEAGPQGAADWYIVYLVLFWSFRQEGKEIWELFYWLLRYIHLQMEKALFCQEGVVEPVIVKKCRLQDILHMPIGLR